MSGKVRSPTKEERLAKALRENLARRKALVRAKRARGSDDEVGAAPLSADAPPSDENLKLRSGPGSD
ncbi:MAG: hypothetical protein J0H65_10815 [Rhizobiales bacterium]|nr:hypothetical protein [Hyphomicrobiales bacterium]